MTRRAKLVGQLGLLCLVACSSPASSTTTELPKTAPRHAQWAVALTAGGDVAVTSVVAGGDGSVFIGGEFAGELSVHGHRIVSRGKTHGFIAKLSAKGRIQWLRSFGAAARDRVTAIDLTRHQQLLVAGDRSNEGFVTSSYLTGKIRWTKTFRSTGLVVVRDLAADGRGGAVVVGHFSGSLTLGNTTVTSAGVTDAFVARFSRRGAPLWLIRAGGTSADHAHAVAVQGDHIIVVGGFRRSAYFGSQLVQSRGKSYDAFVASFDLQGRVRWVKPAGGDRRDTATAVTFDSAGSIYVAGNFDGAASFGAEPILAVDGPDLFVVAITRKGQTRWTKYFAGSSAERAHALAAKGTLIYLLGSFIGTTRFAGYPIRGEQKHDGFLATLTSKGELHGARPLAGKGDESMRDIAIDAKGAAIIVGSFIGATEMIAGKPLANDDKIVSGFVLRVSP